MFRLPKQVRYTALAILCSLFSPHTEASQVSGPLPFSHQVCKIRIWAGWQSGECTGSFVDSRTFITARHCLDAALENMATRHGQDIALDLACPHMKSPLELKAHLPFMPGSWPLQNHDVAVLKFAEPMIDHAFDLQIVRDQSHLAKLWPTRRGFTTLGSRHSTVDVVRAIQQRISLVFKDAYGEKGEVLGFDFAKQSLRVAPGDSGSPLVIEGADGQFYLFGVMTHIFEEKPNALTPDALAHRVHQSDLFDNITLENIMENDPEQSQCTRIFLQRL